MPDDLKRDDLAQLDWAPEQRAASLTQVFEHAAGLAREAEGWYARKRPPKRIAGRALRFFAVVLGAAAAILPILAEISVDDGEPAIAPGWAAAALVGAATLVTLDHFFGLSGAWMRYMTAELAITRLRHQFEYAWNARRATAADPPADADVKDLLGLARDLVLAVGGVVTEETAGWATEIRQGLARTEQGLRGSPP